MTINIGDRVRVSNTASFSERDVTGTVTGPRDGIPDEYWVRLDVPRPSGVTRMSWQARNLTVTDSVETKPLVTVAGKVVTVNSDNFIVVVSPDGVSIKEKNNG